MNRRILRRAAVLPIAAMIAGPVVAATPALAAPRCFGKVATIVGTAGKDELIGTGGPDVIVGLGGDDLIIGRGGADRICGGGGADEIFGAGGKDRLDGGAGQDLVAGGGGEDTVRGGKGHDFLYGGGKDDLLVGGRGDDFLLGNRGDDVLRAGPGWDVLLGQQDDDVLNGGPGRDTASFFFSLNASGISADLAGGTAVGEGEDTLRGIENLEASGQRDAPDQFFGDDGYNAFWPYGGDDLIDGAGGAGGVSFFDAPGPVTVNLTLGTATGEGTDTLINILDVDGSAFDDSLTGNDQPNILFGLEGADTLFGLNGDDFLHGGAGDDTGDGGPGDDTCVSIENASNCETANRMTAAAMRSVQGAGPAGELLRPRPVPSPRAR